MSEYNSVHLASTFADDGFTARNTPKARRGGWATVIGITAPAVLFELPFALAGIQKAIFVFWFYTLLMSPFLVIGLLQSGPYELTCDLRQGTYRYKAGFSLLSKIWTGTLSDFAAVTYQGPSATAQKAGVTGWWVRLEWKRVPTLFGIAPYRWLPVVQTSTQENALEVARWVGYRLGIPVYPANTATTLNVQIGAKSPFTLSQQVAVRSSAK